MGCLWGEAKRMSGKNKTESSFAPWKKRTPAKTNGEFKLKSEGSWDRNNALFGEAEGRKRSYAEFDRATTTERI